MCCEPIRDQDTQRTEDDDSTMQKAQMPPFDDISLNCLESCDGCDGFDGCDGHSGGFYRYMRLRQPNDTSRGHVRGMYREQFGRSLGQQCVNTLGGHRVNTLRGHCHTNSGGVRLNIGIIRMSSGHHRYHQMCSKRFRNKPTGGQSNRSTYTMVWYLDSL
jgi:hypothetical protein